VATPAPIGTRKQPLEGIGDWAPDWPRVGSRLAGCWLPISRVLAPDWPRVGSRLTKAGSRLAEGWLPIGQALGVYSWLAKALHINIGDIY
jgi:hypothetical protein